MAEGWVEKQTLDGMAFYLNEGTQQVQWLKPEALMTPEELEDSKSDWVWVPHKTDMWQAAKVIKKSDDGTVYDVELESGEKLQLKKDKVLKSKLTGGRKQMVPLWEVKKGNLRFLEDDLVMLDPVNEAFIINNLRRRYEEGKIYTWVGAGRSVLVSVNPYKEMNLYGDDQISLHRERPPNKEIPPHVFDVANDSYDAMAFKGVNQSVLISGESGAGKTEATKQCLKYLASVAGSESNIEEKVLVANPLLEAFGNAKTIRNINSSRFGKWMEVYFDRKTTAMKGSKIINYLLERSRVVYQQKNERNYHIFYGLFADEATKSKYNLTTPEDYHYLSQSGCINVPQFNDERNFGEVMDAMDKLGFSDEEKEHCLRLTVAVLLLGNVEFESEMKSGSVDGSKVKNPDLLNSIAEMLEIPSEQVEKVLTHRTIIAGKSAERAVKPLDKTGARYACDSLAMGVYGRLFQWLVDRVNESLGDQDREANRFMGVLDIFGFEIFDNNSFEQLCINFANEKLQQLFNRQTFKEEEELYIAEGVPFEHIEFMDNQVVLDIIEKKPDGILVVLDDELQVPGGEDKKFMNKIEDFHGWKDNFATDKKRRFKNILSFEIVHYAGIVKYDASKFMEKNVDTIFPDMHEALAESKNTLLVQIFADADRKIRTLSKQFRRQLDDLMDVLYKTESRFIRCIKPNGEMSANKFVSAMSVEQLRYSGVFEAVDIRKTGYPFRYTHKQFCYRYSCINPNHKYKSLSNLEEDPVSYVKEILSAAKQDFSDVQIGKTMVLYRANEYKTLRLLRNLALETLIPRAQSVIRGGILRSYKRELESLELALEDALIKANDYDMLVAAIDKANNAFDPKQKRLFDYKPRNLEVANKMAEELENWRRLEQKMAALADVEDPNPHYDELKSLEEEVSATLEKQAKAAESADKDFYERLAYRQPKLTSKQAELHEKIKEQIKACVLGILDQDTTAALAAFDRDALIDCLSRADELNHDTEDLQKARELVAEMEVLEEDADRAVKCVSRKMLQEVLANADRLKQMKNPLVQDAKELDDLAEKEFVTKEYERATEVKDTDRAIHREIRLLQIKYENADANQYAIDRVPGLRTPMEYSKSVKAQETMLVFGKAIKNSLIKTAAEGKAEKTPEDKARVKQFKKDAKANFKNVLQFMGDKKTKDKNAAGLLILERGRAAVAAKDDEMLKEIYLQIIKQCRSNPTEMSTRPEDDVRTPSAEDGTSLQNGLALLGICLSVFPPSTQPFHPTDATFDDFVAIIITTQFSFGGQLNSKKYISALHNTKYGKAARNLDVQKLRADFANVTGHFSIDMSADSGPKEENVKLYMAPPVLVRSEDHISHKTVEME